MEVPEAFICPISGDIMKDPVVDPEGNTYERNEIETWLTRIQTSPITRTILTKEQLSPNRALKEAIDKFLEVNPAPLIKNLEIIDMKNKDNKVSIDSTGMNIRDKTFISINIKPPDFYDEIEMSLEPEPEGDTEIKNINSKIANDIIIIIDNSGSTGVTAETKDATGSIEKTNLSLLDLIKHCIKTIIETATDHDRICLINFNHEATKILDLTHMNKLGKRLANEELDKLISEGQTNLWDGLHEGLKTVRENIVEGRIPSIMLFTDGVPNISPPRGEVKSLNKFIDQYNNNCSINTFGFGIDIQKEILIGISTLTGGSFKYISDPGMVGTIMVNQTANIYSTIANNCLIKIESLQGIPITNIPGHFTINNTSWGKEINIGSIQYDQRRNIIFEVTLPELDDGTPLFNITFEYITRYNEKILCESIICYNNESFNTINLDIFSTYIRTYTIDKILQAYKSSDNSEQVQIIADLISHIESFELKTDLTEALLLDLKDQVNIAFTQYLHKWGQYYIPSLIFAYQQEQCHNFKDKAVQLFGGQYFRNLCDEIEEIFMKIPVPKPQPSPYQNQGVMRGGYVSAAAPAPTSMRQFYNTTGGCFTGDTLIQINENQYLKAKDIKKNQKIITVNNQITEVKVVIKFQVNDMPIIRCNNLGITAWHPIKLKSSNEWFFPISKFKENKENCGCVYNFVLESGHIIIIDNFEAVTLGHNLKNKITNHDYFGNKIIYDLQLCKGWKNGFIEFDKNCFKRKSNTNEISGIDFDKEII